MKALTYHGKRDARVDSVPDPVIQEPTDAIIRITSTAICPFNISCGDCYMCNQGLQSQCETTQVRNQNKGAALLGYPSLYGSVPGGQAEYLRVPQAHYGPIKVNPAGPDERFLFLSDILPTESDAISGTVKDLTNGRRGDAVIDAVGMEAHGGAGAGFAKAAQAGVGLLADALAQKLIEKVGVDRLTALHDSIAFVRRGETVSVSEVYGGVADPMPMMDLFDMQIQLRMGQSNVRRWIDDLLPLLNDPADPLGTLELTTHKVSLAEAPRAYMTFQEKTDGCIKVVIKPGQDA